MRYESINWSLELPEGWEHQWDTNCTTFFHPEGVGAFQVSSYRKKDMVTDNDLREFAGDAPLAAVSQGLLSGFCAQFREGKTFWRKWWLRAGAQLIHVTYNCSVGAQGQEDAEVNSMMASLSPK